MKVVDMFAAGLPCLAIGGYPSVGELVKDGVSHGDDKSQFGMLFDTSEELAEQIWATLIGFEGSDEEGGTQGLQKMRKDLAWFVKPEQSWDAQWSRILAK